MSAMRINKAAAIIAVCAFQAGLAFGSSRLNTAIIHRDAGYEQFLKDDSQVDKALTPARALRWLMSATGHPMHGAPSPIEFQPVVQSHDSQTRIIAEFAYKF